MCREIQSACKDSEREWVCKEIESVCREKEGECAERVERDGKCMQRDREREGVYFEIGRGSVCRDREECLKIKKRECTWREKEK